MPVPNFWGVPAPSPPNVTLVQSVSDPLASSGQTDRQITLAAIQPGQAVFGTVLWENCFQPSSQPGCQSTSGHLDTIKVGNQTAVVIGRYQNARYAGDDLGITVWWLPNVQGSPTTVDYISSSGGFWYDSTVISVFAGLSSNPTVDVAAGATYSGTNVVCCSNNLLVSPSITPASSGEFLYGAGVLYSGQTPVPLDFGPGWNHSNTLNGEFSYRDEWQVYNSTSPVAATFHLTNTTDASYAAIVAIKP